MAVVGERVVVDDTPTLVASGGGDGSLGTLTNRSGAAMFLGDAAVTIDTGAAVGYELDDGDSYDYALPPGQDIYAVAPAPNARLDALRIGV